jgi:hypothetical protein
LRCLVAYGRLSSRVWRALPCFGAAFRNISEEEVSYLDFQIQSWLASIPPYLKLPHPRGPEAENQDRELQQLRTHLHLRGNQMRTLLHRHNVLSTASIQNNSSGARIVVETAKDTIQVLVHLNQSSNIYLRQQVTFNYFLISALAAILLAVCHAPGMYSSQCRESFYNAIQLVRGFSKISTGSRRLWKSVKGLLPGARALGLDHGKESQTQPQHSSHSDSHENGDIQELRSTNVLIPGPDETWMSSEQSLAAAPAMDAQLPDIYQMSQDLTSFYEGFVQSGGEFGMRNDSNSLFTDGADEISRLFQGFI